MSVDKASGLLTWMAVASSEVQNVTVECYNIYGSNKQTIQIMVQPSYSAVLAPIGSSQFPKSFPILLSGNVTFLPSSLLKNTQVPVVIM